MKKSILKSFEILLAAVVLASGFLACTSESGSDGDEKHEHTFATAWTTDGTSHWHAATCEHIDLKKDSGVHKTTAAWQKDENNHWKTCDICKAAFEVTAHTDVAESKSVKKTASITSPGEELCNCSVCGDRNELFCPALGEDGNEATSSSAYVYFGVFPKTVKAAGVVIDEAVTAVIGSDIYYKGSDGEWYAKKTASRSQSTYKYSDGTPVENTEAYFKAEPVKWKVLTTDYNGSGKALLLAENVLTANVHFYISKTDRTIGGKTVYPNNYKYSTLRAYLNGKYEDDDTQTKTYENKGFLQSAFIKEFQDLIAETTVVNDGASTSDATGKLTKADGSSSSFPTDYTCDNTTDKIFVLSEQEATNTACGFDLYSNSGTGNARLRSPTDYALANRAKLEEISTTEKGCWWRLRSPCYNNGLCNYIINYDGFANVYVSARELTSYGVVPALTISLTNK